MLHCTPTGIHPLSRGVSHAALVLAIAIALSAGSAVAQSNESVTTYSIPAGDLDGALQEFGAQSGLHLLYQRELVAGKRTIAITGALSRENALKRLLEGSGLQAERTDEKTYVIKAASGQQAGRQQQTQVVDPNPAPIGSVTELDVIVVTAQKREEGLASVAVPVTVLNGQALADSNQVRVQDYFNKVPGLSLAMTGDVGSPLVSIRGLTTGGATNPTVAIVVDEVPYGSSTSIGGIHVPDIDPGDLERIEVLRGPQGALYGASNIGGLIKYVTIDPTSSEFEGRLQFGASRVRSGDVGHDLRGAANVPLNENLAVRASGFTRKLAGYADNVRTGRSDFNSQDDIGGHVTAMWRPSENFSLKLGATYQDNSRNGSDEVDVTMGGLRRDMLADTGTYDRESHVYSALANVRMGSADLVSVTSYSADKTDLSMDLSLAFGAFYGGLAESYFGVRGVPIRTHYKTDKFSQEARLTFPISDHIDWMVGGFYTSERVSSIAEFLAADMSTGAPVGMLMGLNVSSRYEEYALFSNLTFRITEKFDVMLGGRKSEIRGSALTHRNGPLIDDGVFFNGVAVIPKVRSQDAPFTYLLTPSFKFSVDTMLYARLASGYRPGGPNQTCGIAIPCQFGSDETRNYEVGFKGYFLDRKLFIDASVYYIDWMGIQLNMFDPDLLIGYIDNAGKATSKGFELSAEVKPHTGTKISGWVAYNKAELKEIEPGSLLPASPGERLPFASPWSGSLSIDQEFPVGTNATGFVGGSISYVDARKGAFNAPRQVYPGYTQIDFNVGMRLQSWVLYLYVNNVADKRGVLSGGFDSSILEPNLYTYTRPRTVGVTVTKYF